MPPLISTSIFIPVLLLIAACSQTPTTTTTRLPPQDLSALPDRWAVKAKLGIRTDDNSGSVILNWVQDKRDYRIHVQGALGQGQAVIYGNEDYITIERPGKAPLFSTDARRLIVDTFGWDLPIDHFSYWIRGMVNPQWATESLSYNPSGTLNTLEQSLWSLRYSRYQTVAAWQLPGRIQARQGGAQLTLIIREWQLH